MPLWKLTPIDMENPNWEASTHKGEVIARAETEEKARSLCVSAFGTGATKGHVGATIIPYPPWKYPEHVLCQLTEIDIYEAEGPDAIFEP